MYQQALVTVAETATKANEEQMKSSKWDAESDTLEDDDIISWVSPSDTLATSLLLISSIPFFSIVR
jgi:hypothetical protein